MLTEEQWKRVTDLWLSDEYSPVDIRQELGVAMDVIEVAIRRIDYVYHATRTGMLEKIKEAFDRA